MSYQRDETKYELVIVVPGETIKRQSDRGFTWQWNGDYTQVWEVGESGRGSDKAWHAAYRNVSSIAQNPPTAR